LASRSWHFARWTKNGALLFIVLYGATFTLPLVLFGYEQEVTPANNLDLLFEVTVLALSIFINIVLSPTFRAIVG
jgi:hypothetical protein